ncbi:unnamed protein product [Clonostachys solani]|uniref:Flavin reductase like domain-containing protein n=1 Tax=Clonostachys solani TaxID=160281 RepID=A0A9N9Z4M9_9HYPO|nr:unnamed protein product [Clonostachys solani]
MADKVGRNPHPDFKKVEASREEWDTSADFRYTKTAAPDWKFGDGANRLHDEAGKAKKHIAIDPYTPGRPWGFNYKLLISGVTPRPVAFLSTLSADGASANLAPFSFFNVVSEDPPLLAVGFARPGPDRASKDSLRNLRETGECVVNIISEHFVEAANAASVDAPHGVSEWTLSGLTPAGDCETVACARVKEAVFSIEAKLDYVREYDSRVVEGRKGGTIAILEATRFWVREDALNEDQNLIDISVLKPMSRLGGITYGRTTQGIELLRPDFEKDAGGREGFEKINDTKK